MPTATFPPTAVTTSAQTSGCRRAKRTRAQVGLQQVLSCRDEISQRSIGVTHREKQRHQISVGERFVESSHQSWQYNGGRLIGMLAENGPQLRHETPLGEDVMTRPEFARLRGNQRPTGPILAVQGTLKIPADRERGSPRRPGRWVPGSVPLPGGLV
ncbi:hypothetical protein MUNTM_20600 [Mycobacterium sp. MUNTM1]